MRTACVTGATGCVGRNLVDELLKDSWDVTVLHRKSSDLSRLAGCDVRCSEVDLYDPESVKRVVPAGLDAFFHVAGNTSYWAAEAEQQWKDNVLATRNVVEALCGTRTRMIFTSTGATLGCQHLDGQSIGRIRNGYVRTKRQAELEIYRGIEHGLDAVILHPIIVIGAYDYNSYAQIFRNMRNRWLRICIPGSIAFCHAADVARAHIQACAQGRSGEQYVLGGTHTTWFDVFRRICRRVGTGDPIVLPKAVLLVISQAMAFGAVLTGRRPPLTPDLVRLLGDAPDVAAFDQWKAWHHLGYRSRPLDDMIDDCHNWLAEESSVRQAASVLAPVAEEMPRP